MVCAPYNSNKDVTASCTDEGKLSYCNAAPTFFTSLGLVVLDGESYVVLLLILLNGCSLMCMCLRCMCLIYSIGGCYCTYTIPTETKCVVSVESMCKLSLQINSSKNHLFLAVEN